MKLFLLIFLLCSFIGVSAEHNVNVYVEENGDGFRMYADNYEFCPVSIEVTFKLANLESSEGSKKVFVIPAKSKKNKVTDLITIREGKAFKMSYTMKMTFGNINSDYDKDFKYYLPLKKNVPYKLSQGYNGRASHQNVYALDFMMPSGTEIYAARGGTVIEVVESHNKSCNHSSCNKYNNYITVYHDDGSFSEYNHIKRNGSIVKEGEIIEIGQLIGYSGNTGWTTGPHLHFSIFLERIGKRETIPTKFLVGDGSKAELLVERKYYKRQY